MIEHASAELAASVRQRRRELGLRQEELADLAGTSQRFVHVLETGKPTVQLDKVLAVLGVLGLGLRVIEGDGRISADPGGGPAA
jgi:HTH-type transcriptional regulator / antitoxin HipB